MSEPLTNKKRFKLFYLKIGGIERSGLAQDDNGNLVDVDDLKSALEEFEKECTETSDKAYKLKQTFVDMSNSEITGCKIGLMSAIGIMKKAFPTIYELDTEVEK